MAEAFVKTFKRDNWFDDDNHCHPHRALKMMSPREFRIANSQA